MTGSDLATRYDMRVPRYTSYPTAPHFSEAVDGRVYAGWLEGLDADPDVSVYVHIPFCDTLCWFCGCHTKIVRNYRPVASYLEVLFKEIAAVAGRIPGRPRIRHLHWGGGSPTILTGEDWRRIADLIHDHFEMTADAEMAVEMDPRDATEAYVRDIAEAGVNRVSIGVQDFHPDVQKAINRDQSFEVTQRLVGWLGKHGIARLNMDLMYGLPYQTVPRLLSTIDQALRLSPQRIALFGYAHVPWMKAHQTLIDEAVLPDVQERWAQFSAASRRLVEAGYVAIGLDHFALPDDDLARAQREGRLHRNFQGYTVDESPTLIGFGASAIGSLPQGYVQNAVPIDDYKAAVQDGRLPVVKGIELSADDRLRRAVIERLMCDLAVDLDAVIRVSGMAEPTDFSEELDRLAPLVADGLVTIEGNRIVLTETGRPFVRLAAAAFDRYLQSGRARHSRAV